MNLVALGLYSVTIACIVVGLGMAVWTISAARGPSIEFLRRSMITLLLCMSSTLFLQLARLASGG